MDRRLLAALLFCLAPAARSADIEFVMRSKIVSFTSRAETLASLDRFKQLAKNVNATVIIQHDARDIDKLPVFPASAK